MIAHAAHALPPGADANGRPGTVELLGGDGGGPNSHAPRCVVIDTNCVLDLWLFADPRVASLGREVLDGAVRWLATPAMRAELRRVLGYPAIVRQCALRGVTAEAILATFDRWAQSVSPAPVTPMRCSDPDDQPFIDLAAAWHADLYSRDHAVRALARRLRVCGVRMPGCDTAAARATARHHAQGAY